MLAPRNPRDLMTLFISKKIPRPKPSSLLHVYKNQEGSECKAKRNRNRASLQGRNSFISDGLAALGAFVCVQPQQQVGSWSRIRRDRWLLLLVYTGDKKRQQSRSTSKKSIITATGASALYSPRGSLGNLAKCSTKAAAPKLWAAHTDRGRFLSHRRHEWFWRQSKAWPGKKRGNSICMGSASSSGGLSFSGRNESQVEFYCAAVLHRGNHHLMETNHPNKHGCRKHDVA
jgi:hypothetical protein